MVAQTTERTIEVLSPVVPSNKMEQALASQPRKRQGLTLGVLDNGKPQAGLLLETLAGMVQERLPLKQKAMASKTQGARGPGYAAGSDLLDSFGTNVDLVINGVGD